MMVDFSSRSSCILLPVVFLLTAVFRVKAQCFNNATASCVNALNSTMYFPPSSKTTALQDLDQIRSRIFFPDQRCDVAIQFSACYLLNVPCVDSLPRPICMDDCIVAETILRYSCVNEFQLVLVINNTLSHIVGQFDCHRPETYIEGTTNYSTQCFPLVKLRQFFADDITKYRESTTVPATISPSTTISPPDDGNVVAIVMSTLVGTAWIIIIVSLLIWRGLKRRRQQQYDAPLTQPVAAGYSNPSAVDKLNVYDDSTISNYTDMGFDNSVESSY